MARRSSCRSRQARRSGPSRRRSGSGRRSCGRCRTPRRRSGAGSPRWSRNRHAGAGALDLAEALMGAVGQTVRLDDEGQMDAVTAVSGSGPAYVFLMVEALAAAGEAEGLSPDLALALARATVAGPARWPSPPTRAPAGLRVDVTSPGGTTAAALAVLMDEEAGLPAAHAPCRRRGGDPEPRTGRLTLLHCNMGSCNLCCTATYAGGSRGAGQEKETSDVRSQDLLVRCREDDRVLQAERLHQAPRRPQGAGHGCRGAGGRAAEEHGRAGAGQQGGGRGLPGSVQEADADLRGDDGRGARST